MHPVVHKVASRKPPVRQGATRRLTAAVLCVGLAAAGCAAPPPTDFLSGRIDATAFGDIPGGVPIAVAAPDDTPRGIRLTRLLVDALTARGIAAESNAALVLAYRATTTPASSRDGFPDIGLAGVIGSSGTRDFGLTIGLPIFGWGKRPDGRYRYVVELTLDERDGSRLWQARAAGFAGTRDVVEIARTVFPVLLDQLGRTARGVAVSDPPPQ